jgi:glycosyltransferase involved in cell wall biosynthesis
MTPRITVVTAGHPSTSPRMLKAADAFADAGYHVRVVSTRFAEWAWEMDQIVRQRRSSRPTWSWRVVDYDRSTARVRQLVTGARLRSARAAAHAIGTTSLALAARALGRVHDELVAAIGEEPADFIYGGTTGALAATAAAAARMRVPYGVDFEDFHSGDQGGEEAELLHHLAETIEKTVIAGAAVVTASSPMIAESYASKYGRRPLTVHNTFSLQAAGSSAPNGSLRLYWFSQTLGPGRGLEDVVRAVGQSGIDAQLSLRARAIPEYASSLTTLANAVAPSLSIVYEAPGPPDDMVELARPFDIGLSCEQPEVPNHRWCLGNKIFTYLAAGVPVLLTSTPAQAALAQDLGQAAFVYQPGDVEGLSEQLSRLAAERSAIREAKIAAQAAAERRWHWEHPSDRGALLNGVRSVVG